MSITSEVVPFVLGVLAVFIAVVAACKLAGASWGKAVVPTAIVALVLIGYLLYFFRDPERTAPADKSLIVAGADGVVARIKEVREDEYLKTDTVRISIFLSLLNVHVNRAPITGESRFLGYFPGKRLFTFQEKSSEVNQHNAILIEGAATRCLVKQIVGPVCRRVVYWPDHEKTVKIAKGERIGMMKFGSRLDMYFPRDDVTITVKEGDKVKAGESVVARLKSGT